MNQIAIIGLGYVGLPIALRFSQSGIKVIGLDIDVSKIEKLQSGQSYIRHITNTEIVKELKEGNLSVSTDFSKITQCEAVIICVPTPLTKNREPDISYIIKSAETIASFLKKGTLIVLESTTYPGTTDTDLKEVLESGSGMKAGQDFFLAFSPEREDPGRTDYSVKSIPKIVGGFTETCLKKCVSLYSKALDNIYPVSSCKTAEATKLLENIFRSVNIAIVNELKMVYASMGIDIWEVIQAAKTKPFGFMPFYPGPGIGGHCIPVDPFYLTWKARELEIPTSLIELAGEINISMTDYVINQVIDALNDQKKSVNGSKILILGLAYKANVDDDRESPSYVLMEKLKSKGAIIAYNDPFIPKISKNRKHAQFAGLSSQPITDQHDLLLIATAHDYYKNYEFSTLPVAIVDTRNCITNKPPHYYKA